MAARGEGPKCYMWSRKMLSWPLKSMIFWSAWARLDLATIRRKGPRSISPSNPVGIATFDDTSNVAAEFAGGRRTSVEPSNVACGGYMRGAKGVRSNSVGGQTSSALGHATNNARWHDAHTVSLPLSPDILVRDTLHLHDIATNASKLHNLLYMLLNLITGVLLIGPQE